MNLQEAYQAVRPSVAAVTAKYLLKEKESDADPPYPPIMGTGFVIHPGGLIATNRHVIDAITSLFRPGSAPSDEWPAHVRLFKEIEGQGLLEIPLEIEGVAVIEGMSVKGAYYGPVVPDLGFIRVKCRGLPELRVVDQEPELAEGVDVATAGFPMGTEALTAPGYLHQLTPLLQTGVISAVLPFACKHPHAFVINVMCQGGASGSPVFLPQDGRVVGALYAGLRDRSIGRTRSGEPVLNRVPTNFSYVVPAHFLRMGVDGARGEVSDLESADYPTLEELISREEWSERTDLGEGRPSLHAETDRPAEGRAWKVEPGQKESEPV